MMNSPITWIGGKRLLRKEILAELPEDISCYVEVFGGAAWVLFGKEKNTKVEVYNDVNSNLVNLFRCMKYHGTALQEELNWCMVSREMFEQAVKEYENLNLTDIQRAARFFMVVKCSFGARLKYFTGKRVSLMSGIENMECFQKRLRNTLIEQMDFEKLIKTYDGADTLFYADPPYYQTEKLYGDSFKREDHMRLKNSLKEIRGRFILTYNDCPYIRELYREYPIREVGRQSNLATYSTQSDFKELIIKNF